MPLSGRTTSKNRFFAGVVLAGLALVACSGGGSFGGAGLAATTQPSASGSAPPAADSRLRFASGFSAVAIAHVDGARELASLPNGDLLVGTSGSTIAIVPDADGAGAAGAAQTFVTLGEGRANGIAVSPAGAIYAATTTTVWRIPYASGDRTEPGATAIAHVRTGPIAPNSDGDVHRTTSVVASGNALYVGVGSSCNACVETDATRAAVFRMAPDGSGAVRLVKRSRNPMALAVDPATGALFIGGAGQDGLSYGHPYEYMDSPTAHGNADVDYGWPGCEENHIAYNPLRQNPAPDCASAVAPAIEFPAYATLIGATFYAPAAGAPYAFPAAYRGGLFVTSHGSWHCCPATTPRVYFVPMHGDTPATAVNWNDPTVQHSDFVSGYGSASKNAYIGRPTGIAVGANGSLFVADDRTGTILRIRRP
jgi:glucose/arabinose dehydrogenase